jgi:hypothetical protein
MSLPEPAGEGLPEAAPTIPAGLINGVPAKAPHPFRRIISTQASSLSPHLRAQEGVFLRFGWRALGGECYFAALGLLIVLAGEEGSVLASSFSW